MVTYEKDGTGTFLLNKMRVFSGYESRSIHLGLTEHSTLVLPKLLLRAVSITDVRAADEIRQLLQDAKA